ncbi:MAG: YdcF family protein [Sphingobacteriaceae bacterium]|nr:MAG: YdcF family protein [Sphingobacteriaceae bacterium]
MYFFFSKVLLIFIFPLTWVLVLLIVALVSKNKKRKYRSLVAALILLVLFTNPFLFNQFAQSWDVAPYKPDNRKYSCVIVLGGFSTGSDKGDGYFNTAADRFIQGTKLLSTGQASHLLITGGSGSLLPDEFREAIWVKKQLKEFNYPDSAILIESASRNTKENAKFSKVILDKAKLSPPYLLVTSAFHMRRSAMIFKNAGIVVVTYPANYLVRRKATISDLMPDASVLSSWNTYIREVVGYVANSI